MVRARKTDPPAQTQKRELLPEPEPMSVQDTGNSLVIREGDIFLLTDGAGQVSRGNRQGHGLYHRDTRYLSGYELTFTTARPLVLLSTAELGYSSEQVMTNPTMADANGEQVSRGTIQLRRTRVVDDLLEERLHVHNHNPFPVSIELQYRLAADFADIFEVRGWEAEKRGETRPPGFDEGRVVIASDGADGRRRETTVVFSPEPDSLAGDEDLAMATYRLDLASQERRDIYLGVALDRRIEAPHDIDRLPVVAARHERWLAETTRIETGSEFFDAIMERSLADVRMLWTVEGGSAFPAAGTPWFDALFGRDSCVVGMQMLAFRPDIARAVLAALASLQGTKNDAWRDEEPGKIPHELRRGELTCSGELPFSPYYGSVDSTPLFLMLAAELFPLDGRHRVPGGAAAEPGGGAAMAAAVRRHERRRLHRL